MKMFRAEVTRLVLSTVILRLEGASKCLRNNTYGKDGMNGGQERGNSNGRF